MINTKRIGDSLSIVLRPMLQWVVPELVTIEA